MKKIVDLVNGKKVTSSKIGSECYFIHYFSSDDNLNCVIAKVKITGIDLALNKYTTDVWPPMASPMNTYFDGDELVEFLNKILNRKRIRKIDGKKLTLAQSRTSMEENEFIFSTTSVDESQGREINTIDLSVETNSQMKRVSQATNISNYYGEQELNEIVDLIKNTLCK